MASLKKRKKPRPRGYVRPSRAKPKTGWSARQLASLSGIGVRTIRLYVARGVLPRPTFQGAATRYQRPQLLWLVATRRLLRDERLSLVAIRKRLQALSASELETFATERLAPGPLADALGVSPVIPVSAAASTFPFTFTEAGFQDGGVLPVVPRWARLELALGLELHVRDDASPRVLALAGRVRELCEGAAQGTVNPSASKRGV